MNAACLLSVSPEILAALRLHLSDIGSALSPSEAATLAIVAWLHAEEHRDAQAAGVQAGYRSTTQPAAARRDADAGPVAEVGGASGSAAENVRTNADLSDAAPGHLDASTNARAPTLYKSKSQSNAKSPCAQNGYQWKELFLPQGTELRMRSDDAVHHARVSGDAILYQGRPVSPRQFTLAVAGDGRNAWRDVSLRLPGEKQFLPAGLLRRRAQADIRIRAEAALGDGAGRSGGSGRRESPADTIATAAEAMAEALRTALALVEHSNAQLLPKYERRVDFHRRAADVIADHIKFD